MNGRIRPRDWAISGSLSREQRMMGEEREDQTQGNSFMQYFRYWLPDHMNISHDLSRVARAYND